jgi:hypothetical protein
MKTRFSILISVLFLALGGFARADGRPGSVEWSDGRKLSGALSLTPGKALRLFTATEQVELQLAEVKDIRFKVEKEEMQDGFYFPNAGQATQVKTGEVYPVRYLQTEITLADGKVLDGHLFTTMLYVETDDATEKVPLVAKQTGTNGEKLADLAYPTLVRFDSDAPAAGTVQIDLTHAGLTGIHQLVTVSKPDLALLPALQVAGKQIWTVPLGDPNRLLFSVEAPDGVHVAWPDKEADPVIQQAVATSLNVMRDFFDTRTLLGCFADTDEGDVYTLVMLGREGKTYSFDADKKPWSLVILRWKYDPDQKKTTLLNRVPLLTGRAEGNSQPPAVFKQPELLQAVTPVAQTAPAHAPAPEGVK